VVDDVELAPVGVGERSRQHALLEPVGDLVLAAARAKQLVLVPAPVGGVEHARPDLLGAPFVVPA
jgi:hypothetical protein